MFDSTWTPVYRKIESLPYQVQEGAEVLSGTLIIDEVALHVAPGRYQLGVQVTEANLGLRGAYTSEVVVESYGSDSLRLSDLEMAGQVVETPGGAKGGLRVVPMPSHAYRPGQPVTVYYEVYGLGRDRFGQTKYQMDYEIRPKRGKLSAVRVLRALGTLIGMEEKAVVTISYEQTGSEPTENNYLEIDMGKSSKGEYELKVTITDRNTDQQTVKQVLFHVAE